MRLAGVGNDRLGRRVDLRILVGEPQRRCGEINELGLVGQQRFAGAPPGVAATGVAQRILRGPPQLGNSVVGLLHPAPRPCHRLVHRVLEAVRLGVPQHAQGGLMASHDRTVVQSPAIAELTQRQAGRATKQEHETDHHPILAHPRSPTDQPSDRRAPPTTATSAAHVPAGDRGETRSFRRLRRPAPRTASSRRSRTGSLGIIPAIIGCGSRTYSLLSRRYVRARRTPLAGSRSESARGRRGAEPSGSVQSADDPLPGL